MAKQYVKGLTTLAEEVTCDRLPVEGAVPSWLSGSLLRTGPARFEVGGRKYRHWFDGLAMLHRFSFERGSVSYANKYLHSPAYLKAQETGKISYSEFATDPCRSIFKRVTSAFHPELGANANVNISKIGEEFVALTEIPLPVEFDPQTLETLGIVQHNDDLVGQHCTPHPHYDPARHMGVNSITNFGSKSSYHLYGIKDGQTKRTPISSIAVQQPAYIHSFGMTERYIVLVEFPLVVNPLNMLVSGKPFIENFHWKPEQGTRFLLISKDSGEVVKTFEYEAFFAFHHINAFERGDEVVVDICALPDNQIIDALYLDKLMAPETTVPIAAFTRYTLPLTGGKPSAEVMSDEGFELPRINYEQNNGRDYRFAYGVSTHRAHPDDFIDQLVKVDVHQRKTAIWYEEGYYPGEPIFVASPDAHSEDEGVVLSVVLDGGRGNSFLLILDAQNFSELARVEVPHHIPFGFHGMYTRQ